MKPCSTPMVVLETASFTSRSYLQHTEVSTDIAVTACQLLLVALLGAWQDTRVDLAVPFVFRSWATLIVSAQWSDLSGVGDPETQTLKCFGTPYLSRLKRYHTWSGLYICLYGPGGGGQSSCFAGEQDCDCHGAQDLQLLWANEHWCSSVV